ncbi:tetratricopeptide repeat protein [Prosthecochloris sp.]|uniref:tetratricopeptide repeat protein n=1 Tax=Prosthecochloris sp. TaxID=290513 RepID=UPI0025EEF020|nr:tetratricopeptide repeat protein [Prosthecochloris sp.]
MVQSEQRPEGQIPPIETDDHAEKADRLLEFFIFNKNLIIGATLGVIVIAGGLFFYQQQRNSDEIAAYRLLSQVESHVDNGNWQQAVDGDSTMTGLRKIIREYGSTPSGNHAKVLIGDSFLALQEADSAMTYYRTYTGKNRDLAASAKAGEAASLLHKKAYSEAAAAFEKASETALNHALKASYLSDAADTYLLLNNRDMAVDLYKRIIRKYPGFTATAKVQESLLAIAGKTGNVDL